MCIAGKTQNQDNNIWRLSKVDTTPIIPGPDSKHLQEQKYSAITRLDKFSNILLHNLLEFHWTVFDRPEFVSVITHAEFLLWVSECKSLHISGAEELCRIIKDNDESPWFHGFIVKWIQSS